MNQSRRNQSGFTLLELLAAVVVMSVISVTLMPIIGGASESYVSARDVRTSTESVANALDRITRIVRKAPIGSGNTGVDVASSSVTSVAFSDGTGVQLVGTTLEMLVVGGGAVPLCFDVDSFTIDFIGADGVVDTSLTPTQTHRFGFTILSNNVEMSVIVHPRVWIGQ
jgi:prepilin-type N-terminal cleavage/methylation domain-containing protein